VDKRSASTISLAADTLPAIPNLGGIARSLVDAARATDVSGP
jgi:hypothetical protein